jgi:hypothetical protein
MNVYQKMLSNGEWSDIPQDRLEMFLNRVSDRAALESGAEVRYTLRDGDFGLKNPSQEWYQNIRIQPAPRAPYAQPNHRFTCATCGEHRDTTRRGHCDDCE